MEKTQNIQYITPETLSEDKPIWINPVGGMGDIIMLSTAMLRSYERYGKKFNVARRSHYTSVFRNHPAVQEIGHPTEGSLLLCNDYWSRVEFADKNNKALFLLYKIFGVEDEKSEQLFFPEDKNVKESTRLILDNVPWTNKTVVISCSSASPRKMMHPSKWHIIVQKLLAQHCFVVQVGTPNDIPIYGTYSLIGATRIMQMPKIIEKANLVITPDNYIMHVAKLVEVPTIALFGPTEQTRYGYSDHVCMQADNSDCKDVNSCLGPHVPQNYITPCPLCENHCMNKFDEAKIVDIAMSILNT